MFFTIFTSVLISTIDLEAIDSSNSKNLAIDMRRKLMHDNYDYISSENDLNNDSTGKLINPDDHHRADDTDKKDLISEILLPRAHNDGNRKIEEVTVNDKDLIYYMNDERLERATANVDDYDLIGELNATTPKVKYKVLKVNNPNRRSMTFQRFIQEEKGDGVAIMNLDDGPFPEFRLPKSRRQYMQDTENSMTLSEPDDQLDENSTQREI